MIKELLMASNYWVLNKTTVKEFGIETAFILINLVEAESTLADEEGWFYQTANTIEEITGLSNHKQTAAIKQLIECGVIEQKNKGVPMKRYFRINFEKIQSLVFKKIENCDSKNLKTSIQKISNNKELTYKEPNIKNNNKPKGGYDLIINSYTQNEELKDTILEFIKMRKAIKKPLTDRAVELMLSKLDKLSKNKDTAKIEILNQSIENSWQGIFELKKAVVEEPKRVLKYV